LVTTEGGEAVVALCCAKLGRVSTVDARPRAKARRDAVALVVILFPPVGGAAS
jgi:hypothetical protein